MKDNVAMVDAVIEVMHGQGKPINTPLKRASTLQEHVRIGEKLPFNVERN